MTSFIGEYQCSVDVKGRIMLPSAFKKQMDPVQEKFAVRKGIYVSCLALYPWNAWEQQILDIRRKLNLNNREQNQLFREFLKNTAELVLDNTNRILIPKYLLGLAGIKKEVMLHGMDSQIEIWAKENYVSGIPDEDDFATRFEKHLGSSNNSQYFPNN
ncbi:MAG: division/cell wall cluster transcriptional repressor MraZ [Bacteroidia bacterium]|nr:division/cell wall cluster transcriptional repressor MraZ [Bacteroidia bacterium]